MKNLKQRICFDKNVIIFINFIFMTSNKHHVKFYMAKVKETETSHYCKLKSALHVGQLVHSIRAFPPRIHVVVFPLQGGTPALIAAL